LPKRIAIIIVHLHGFDLTNGCLCSLAASGCTGFDVVLVDNGSSDGSAAQLKARHPYIMLLRSPHNAGFTGGNNLGMQYALKEGYELVLLLNNDTFVSPGFLAPLLRYLDQNRNVAAVQPKIFFHHDHNKLWSAGSFFNKALGFTYTRGLNKQDQPAYDTPVQVDWISGCALLVRSAVLRQTGLFADNMFLYFEDADLSFRIRQAGYKLAFVPASVIYHIAGASGKKEGQKNTVQPFVYYYNLRNRIWFLKRYSAWYLLPTVVLANSFYIGALMGFFLLRGRTAKFKAVLNALKDGWRGQISEGEQPTPLTANAKERVRAV
jgi:GT2 family glycosyltransferase